MWLTCISMGVAGLSKCGCDLPYLVWVWSACVKLIVVCLWVHAYGMNIHVYVHTYMYAYIRTVNSC